MFRFSTAALILLVSVQPAPAQDRIDFEDYRLDNGLRVILAEDHSVPVVTIDIWYSVGSSSEEPNRSGFAHLFEHMMFQGSEHLEKAEHAQFVERAGGDMNGTTNEDRTAYYETLPANRLNLGLWLEADRMRSLAITAENFENQRQAVKEERRLRLDNQPYTWVFFEAPHLSYDSTTCFAYAHSIIGSMDDLDAAEVTDVQEFFDLHYAPNNATLTVVGDFDPSEVKQLIEQYFGAIPRGNATAPVRCDWGIGTEAEQIEHEDPHATLPMVAVTYRIPGHSDNDTPALQILSLILGSGESSRLNRALVREQQSALQAQSFVLSRRSASTFMLMAVANQGAEPATIKNQLDAVVTRILNDGVSEAELEKAKNAYRSSDIFGRQTTMQIAENIQHYGRYHDSLDEIHTDLDAYMAVTRDDVRRVARKYLVPENSFTINNVPPSAGQPAVP